MTSNSTRQRRPRKTPARPAKPYEEFPLYAHPLGYWSKKINKKILHFGRWGRRVNGRMEHLPYEANWQKALAAFSARVDDAHAGRIRETVVQEREVRDGLSIAELCNKFLTSKLRKMHSGELSPRSLQEYKHTTNRLVSQFGKQRLVDDLTASDFEQLRADIAKRCGPYRLGNEITRTKSVFKYAVDNGLIDRPIRFGSEFRKPGKAVMRRHKAASDKKLFEAAELRLLLDALDGREVSIAADKKTQKPANVKLSRDPQLRAIVLLGINAGAGNTDIAGLQAKHLDLAGGWLNYPRGKTGIGRRVPLWNETIAALKEAIAARPTAKDKADADCVFLTSSGTRMVRVGPHKDQARVGETTRTDYVSREFGKLLGKLKINGRRGLGYYSLRHTLATIALQTRDRDAVRAIMGHVENDMLAAYDETGPSDERLKAVTDHVRGWLFGDAVSK
jgi:integrase